MTLSDLNSAHGLTTAAGRFGLASLFLLGGLNKLLNYSTTFDQMVAVEIPFSAWVLPIVIALELGGGAIVAVGHRGAPLAAGILAAFTIATNIVFHDFWNMQGDVAKLELALFFKNVSIAGGLLFLAGTTTQVAAQ